MAENETTPEETTDGGTATAESEPIKLKQSVDITDIGPCKKHIKVTVDRGDIDERLGEKYKELLTKGTSFVSGFRPGKAPRKIVERFYKADVEHQVRGEVLMASLEQIADEQDIAPLTPPDLDPTKITIPEDGPLIYEFDVEVRPQFELPNYKGLKLKRPVQTFTDADVDAEIRRLLEPYGQVVPKEGKPATAAIGDIITTDIRTTIQGQLLNEVKEARIRVEPQLVLKDGLAKDFGKQIKGAKAGDTRSVEIVLSDAVANPTLRGQTVQAAFVINDIKTVRLPEINQDILDEFGAHSEEQLREMVRVVLERRLEYQQRQAMRQQVIALVADSALAELPQDLLMRQARRAMQRKAIELQSAGLNETEINSRLRMMQQDIVRSTTSSLKEHFVLQKIVEVEKIEVDDDDVDAEIERIAARSDESPRKVRARLEREDMLESLATELLESKALDLILDNAEFEDVPLTAAHDEPPAPTVEAQAVPGELQDPTDVPEPVKESDEE
ncbi:MAG: trigger factor [Acidobacteria bacterium]|nr:trigger factor [Acidobacteriota bacterium]